MVWCAGACVAVGGEVMSACVRHVKTTVRSPRSRRAASALRGLPSRLAARRPEAEPVAPDPRPVRTVTVEKREAGVPVTLTGRIEAEDEVALAFRIAGRVLENNRRLGGPVGP